jgi:CRISPR-associated protein Csx17
LGDYLAGVGVLLAAATVWPDVRGCWRDGAFVLLDVELDPIRVEASLLKWRPRPYARWWASQQKFDTKAKTDGNVWAGRNIASDEASKLLDAHIVGVDGRNRFNPIFGTGGNIGKRDLAAVYSEALSLIETGDQAQSLAWLRGSLFGGETAPLPKLVSAGTWFVYANKAFNNGQDWYREGQLSPWSFLFALEGARLLAGAASRRLSAARHYAVFPFVSETAVAEASGESDAGRAEFWAPLWAAPASIFAVRALFARGHARVGARAASSAYEFALAARIAGVDAGVTSFMRFSLRRTTSRQTYEAVPRQRIESKEDVQIGALARLSTWIEKLPRDGPNDKQFFGIRGRVEEALIRLAEEPEEPERWQAVLLVLAQSQFQIDRNQNLRKTCRPIPLLNSSIFNRAWPSPPPEIQIAQAVAAVRTSAYDTSKQRGPKLLQENIFGVEGGLFPRFPEQRPASAVWNEITPLNSMTRILEHRLIDGEKLGSLPLESHRHCSGSAVHRFVEEVLDDEQIGRWIPALSLLDWGSGSVPPANIDERWTPGGASRLHDLFRPLFAPRRDERLRVVAARQLLKLFRQGSWDEAIALARRRVLADRQVRIIETPRFIDCDGERIAAAMLIPMSGPEVEENFIKWTLRRKEEQ